MSYLPMELRKRLLSWPMLKVYGEKSNPEFLNTARFLQIIRYWWDSFNVKAKDVGSKKRDHNKDPISIDNLEEKTERFQAILDEWLRKRQESCKENKMKHHGLTDETFLTFHQSTSSIISISSYLIHHCHFKIEGRFGWLRQSCGGNYYAEKSIRLRSLLRFNQLSIKEIRVALLSDDDKRVRCEAKENTVLLLSSITSIEHIGEVDCGLLYYIAGFVAKRLTSGKVIKSYVPCQLLIKRSDDEIHPCVISTNESPDNLNLNEDNERTFLSRINRCGLIEPSLLVITVKECWSLYSTIFNRHEIKYKFLSVPHPLLVFEELLPMFIDSYEFSDQLSVVCINKHKYCHNLPTVAKIIFNLMVGNFVRDTNNLIHQQNETTYCRIFKRPKDEAR